MKATKLLFLLWLLTLWAPLALGVSSGWDEPPQTPPGDEDRAAALEAFRAEDWPGLVEHMARVAQRRPWDDEAHNLLGFGHRKLGNYDRALEHYHRALELNPHNKGALEYLGEAYLELDRPGDAAQLLDRLASECRRSRGEPADCEEWRELKAAFEAYRCRGS